MQEKITPHVTLENIEEQIKLYVDCWKEHGSRFINIPEESLPQNYFVNITTPCEDLLIIRKYPMNALTYDAFRKLPILLLDTQKYQVNHDHFYYRAFVADLYEFMKNELQPFYDSEISDRLKLLMDIIYIDTRNPFPPQERQMIDKAIQTLAPNIVNVQRNMFIITAHLTYPLLEGLGRRMSSAFMESDGKLKASIANFESLDGEKVSDLDKNRRINSIATLLRILETKIADNRLRKDLEQYRSHFEAMYSKHFDARKTYDIIFDSRNSLLHGERYWQTFYGAIVNLICLLINSKLSATDYDSKYAGFIEQMMQNIRTRSFGFSPFGSCYYPPV